MEDAAMNRRKHFASAAVAAMLLFGCQQSGESVRSGGAESDSIHIALRLGASTDSLPDSVYFKARWVRVQFTTNTTDAALSIDTVMQLAQGSFRSPAISKSLGYSATVTGIDATGRRVWYGTAAGQASGNDKVVAVAGSLTVPLQAVPAVSIPVASLASGAIDFPDTLRIPSTSGVRTLYSTDSIHWSTFPPVGLPIDSSLSILVQAQSIDTLVGAPYSPIQRFTWTGKTVAHPVWSIAGNRYFPGSSVKADLSCATSGATIQWSTNGSTWTNVTDSLVIDPTLVYQARAIKAHQPGSTISDQTWKWLSSDSAALSSLSIGTAILSPNFGSSVLQYITDSVWGQSYVTVTATPKVNGVQVTCNGTTCSGQKFTISDTGTLIEVSTILNGTPGLTYKVRVPKSTRVIKSDYGIPWNPNISYDTLVDTRDGQKYRTVKIGTQVWMAQNLNYKVDSSWWYNNSPDSGAKYGRLYTWASAMGVSSDYNLEALGEKNSQKYQGACPDNWHLPSSAEWDTLTSVVDAGNSIHGTLLKSTVGWRTSNTKLGNGTDTHGFRAIPSGWIANNAFAEAGDYAKWWTSSELGAPYALYKAMYYNDPIVSGSNYMKPEGFSIRCISN